MKPIVTQVIIIAFLVLATAYPILRMNGSPNADIPAFGALIIALLMISITNARVTSLERTIQKLKADLHSSRCGSDDKMV
jgi:hypothetical protein